MCQNNLVTINHLLLHCPIVADLWTMFLTIFGISWSWTAHLNLKQAVESWSSWKVDKTIKKDRVDDPSLHMFVFIDRKEQKMCGRDFNSQLLS